MDSEVVKAIRLLGPQGLHDALTPAQRQALPYEWGLWARPTVAVPGKARTFEGQLEPPGEWSTCMFLGGRGTGKTRALAEWIRSKAEKHPGCRVHLVGRDMSEARKVGVFGDSGVLNCCPPWDRPDWSPVDAALRWRNGSQLFLYSAEAPSSLRGPQCHFLAADELAAWNRGRPDAAWKVAVLGCRLGRQPQSFIATTPAPIPLLRDLVARESTVILRGRTRDNPFLPESFLTEMERTFGGTAFGRQELDGELLDQVDGALFSMATLERWRVQAAPQLRKIIIGCDPSASEAKEHDESGIVVLGEAADKVVYILADYSGVLTPQGWGAAIVKAFHAWGASYVVAESQKGGAMVSTIIRQTPGGTAIPVRPVPAQVAKEVRAMPVAAASERGQLRLVGRHDDLERQLVSWVPGSRVSPGRLDALVHGALDLIARPPVPSQDAVGGTVPGGFGRRI